MYDPIVSPERPVRFADLVDLSRVDLISPLSADEVSALGEIALGARISRALAARLGRFLDPLNALYVRLALLGLPRAGWSNGMRRLMLSMYRTRRPFWAWSDDEWSREFLPIAGGKYRLYARFSMAVAYLCAPSGLRAVYDQTRFTSVRPLARAVFGEPYEKLLAEIVAINKGLGYLTGPADGLKRILVIDRVLALLVLLGGTCDLGFVHMPLVDELSTVSSGFEYRSQKTGAYAICRALHRLGRLPREQPAIYGANKNKGPGPATSWDDMIFWWRDRQTRFESPGQTVASLRAIARWFAKKIPAVVTPRELDRDGCQLFAAAVIDGHYRDFGAGGLSARVSAGGARIGYKPRSKVAKLAALRGFISDLVRMGALPESSYILTEWLMPPPSVTHQISQDPRPISRDAFAKFLEAALSLAPEDVPNSWYPFELVIGLAFMLALSGLRADEVRRLGVDCFDDHGLGSDEDDDGTVAWLRVPANKYKAEFSKPVSIEVADRVKAWLAVRPTMQAPRTDRRTKRPTSYLFSYRNHQVGATYVNESVIPLICRKAGIADYTDRHGTITCHRLRATLATLLARGKNGMSLLALSKWLGHRYTYSTTAYVEIANDDLSAEFRRAKRRNFVVDVIVDRDAVGREPEGGYGPGVSWRHTVVKDGLCSNERFSECAHRLDCARCEFHVPADDPLAKRLLAGERAYRFQEQLILEPEEIVRLRTGARAKKARKTPKARSG